MTLQYALQRLTFRHWAHYVRSYSMFFYINYYC